MPAPHSSDNLFIRSSFSGLNNRSTRLSERSPAVSESFADGGAVFEGGNLEGVFDHVDVFAGHKQNEETNNGEDAGTVYIRTQTSAKAADEGHVKAGAG